MQGYPAPACVTPYMSFDLELSQQYRIKGSWQDHVVQQKFTKRPGRAQSFNGCITVYTASCSTCSFILRTLFFHTDWHCIIWRNNEMLYLELDLYPSSCSSCSSFVAHAIAASQVFLWPFRNRQNAFLKLKSTTLPLWATTVLPFRDVTITSVLTWAILTRTWLFPSIQTFQNALRSTELCTWFLRPL